MANLRVPTEKVTFDLDIDDQHIQPESVRPAKYKLQVTFFTNESGKATNVHYKVFNSFANAFKWGPELFNYIQIGAEAHSIMHWLNINQQAAIKQDQQLLN